MHGGFWAGQLEGTTCSGRFSPWARGRRDPAKSTSEEHQMAETTHACMACTRTPFPTCTVASLALPKPIPQYL